MRKYKHSEVIVLGKPNTLYVNRIDGTMVYINSIFWFKDLARGCKYCLLPKPGGPDCIRYTHTEFHQVFVELIDRRHEIKKQYVNRFDESISPNINGRIYPKDSLKTDIFAYDLVADQGFFV